MPPFIVYATPRSRTAWLSYFLSYGGTACGHDESVHVRSMADVRSWLSMANTGTVETAAAPFWRIAHSTVPEARVVVLRRPRAAVLDSIMRLPLPFDRERMSLLLGRLERKLDQIERRVPGALAVTYDDLGTEAGCKRVFEHCLQRPHDHAWWAALAPQNIQIDFAAQVRYCAAHKDQLGKAADEIKVRSMRDLGPRLADLPGMTIGVEQFEPFLADAQALFHHHCAIVGEGAHHLDDKDWSLFRQMAENDAFQIVAARSNGRLFGYLMTAIAPDFHRAGARVGVHNAFYASPDAPGLGRRLQIAARDALQARGVSAIVMRTGTRESAPALESIYQRLGAKHEGQIYVLPLGD